MQRERIKEASASWETQSCLLKKDTLRIRVNLTIWVRAGGLCLNKFAHTQGALTVSLTGRQVPHKCRKPACLSVPVPKPCCVCLLCPSCCVLHCCQGEKAMYWHGPFGFEYCKEEFEPLPGQLNSFMARLLEDGEWPPPGV